MQRQWRSPWSPPVGPTSSWQCKTESCAPPGWQSRLCFCPGHSPLYPLPNARLPHGCIPTCPSCGSTFPYCISLAFLSLRGSFPCGAVLSDCHLPGISRRSTGRWYASLAASAHKGYRRSAPATRSPAAFPLCSRALPVNGTSRGGSRNGAADTSSALCAGNHVNFIKRQNLPSKINMIKIQLKNGYVYSTGVSLVNNLNVVVSPMVQKLDLSLYHLVVIGVCQVMPMFKYGLMKSKEFRTACSSFFINSLFYPFNKSFH